MNAFRAVDTLPAFTAADGADICELAGRSTGLISHSLAVIAHPGGAESAAHHHRTADEVYFVWSGAGRVQVEDETQAVGPGDAVIIRAGQRHKLWSDGPGDLVLIVSCAPAYTAEDVVWEED